MPTLFDLLDARSSPPEDYRPDAPPTLDGIDDLIVDCETTGLAVHRGDRPVGTAVAWKTSEGHYEKRYVSWGHRGGGNSTDEATAKRWHQQELRNKKITNLYTGFDNQQLYGWGVDLEAQGCQLADVSHWAALLDDHRRKFSLNALAQDYLKKQKLDIDHKRIADMPAWQVAPYAMQDTALVGELKDVMWPLLGEQDLHRVRQLEDDLIYVVCEMERNAGPIDERALDAALVHSKKAYEQCFWDIHKATGLRVNPDSNTEMSRLIQKLDLPILEHTETGKASFTAEVLEGYDHPVIAMVREMSRWGDLRSKYLVPYREAVGADGLLRYRLHQLRGDDNGTVSGRFSSSDKNIQQVLAVEKQIDKYGLDSPLIRELFGPMCPRCGSFAKYCDCRTDVRWLSVDAEQIEYRLFAHYAASKNVLEAYEKDPWMSFHKHIHAMLLPYKSDLLYKPLKNMNFMKIYGGGLAKLAYMMGYITKRQLEELQRLYSGKIPRQHPLLKQALEIDSIYARELPEVAPLLRRAGELAEHRGYVKTLMGRRARFPHKQRLHSALNRVIQGGAADIMKTKLVELHRARKYTNLLLRMTVHDEIDGDSPDRECDRRVAEVLNVQSFPELKVPILWKGKSGASWAHCEDLDKIRRDYVERHAA